MIDDRLSRRILVAAGILGAMAVAIGAYGAHGLEGFLIRRNVDSETIADRLDQYSVGVQYHMSHVAALLVLAALPYGSPKSRRWAAALFILGIVFFSGSLYVLALMNQPKLGAVTPIGGIILIAAWLSLIFVARRRRTREED